MTIKTTSNKSRLQNGQVFVSAKLAYCYLPGSKQKKLLDLQNEL